MPFWISFGIALVLLFVGVCLKALSRGDDLRIKASDCNVRVSAAASGVFFVINFFIDRPAAGFTEEYKWRLGIFLFVSTVSLVFSLMIARAADQEEKNPAGIHKSMRGFAKFGPFLSIFLAALCISVAITLK